MADARGERAADPIAESLYEVDASDPRGELVDRTGMPAEELAQIGRLMKSLSELREAEQLVSDASQRYMRLSTQDMRAIHYLIVAGNRGAVITPGMLTAHLGISAASTTKLLNRLERGGHITRQVPATETAAMQTVGRQQAKRFNAAARLTPEERETVTRFLRDMTGELSLADVDWAGAAGEDPVR